MSHPFERMGVCRIPNKTVAGHPRKGLERKNMINPPTPENLISRLAVLENIVIGLIESSPYHNIIDSSNRPDSFKKFKEETLVCQQADIAKAETFNKLVDAYLSLEQGEK
jgi:hypothetical protein